MQSQWSDDDAEAIVRQYAERGVNRDLALRIYTSRLLGRDKRLVLHGGGNTSVKTMATDLIGDEVEVLCVKGSGWDMGEIEPAGLPAVRLAPLRRLRARDSLSDEDMVNFQRTNLIDAGAPNPSVETLLHAFLPHKYIDHTHSTAVLSLADQPDCAEVCRAIYGRRMGLVPYIMPGFALARKAAEIYDDDPAVEGLILLKHGIFTFGETAREAYERMIAMVALAEERVAGGRRTMFVPRALQTALAEPAAIAPIIRGACAIADPVGGGAYKRFILDFRGDAAILAYVNGAELARYSQSGVATPDHTIRTKNYPLLVPPPVADALDRFKVAVAEAVNAFVADYHAYFARQNPRHDNKKRELDPIPRIVLVPGVGLFGLGRSARDAQIAADLAECTIETVSGAEAIGRFASIPEDDLFEIEYWSLEQAKLGKGEEKPLAGQIAIITGGGGTIGAATARLFSRNGAEIAVFDRDGVAAEAAAKRVGAAALAIECDVTDPTSVRAAFDAVCARFGGVDIVVSNAGAAWQGRIGEVADAVLRQSFELNFFAHQDGIRANAVNADRIRSGLLTPEMIRSRAAARGVGETDYMAGNLLRREVTAEDVAQAFLHHAVALKTTGDVTTVDGGNINAILR